MVNTRTIVALNCSTQSAAQRGAAIHGTLDAGPNRARCSGPGRLRMTTLAMGGSSEVMRPDALRHWRTSTRRAHQSEAILTTGSIHLTTKRPPGGLHRRSLTSPLGTKRLVTA